MADTTKQTQSQNENLGCQLYGECDNLNDKVHDIIGMILEREEKNPRDLSTVKSQ